MPYTTPAACFTKAPVRKETNGEKFYRLYMQMGRSPLRYFHAKAQGKVEYIPYETVRSHRGS